MKKQQPFYKGLDTVPVFYTDISELSPELFVITEFPTQLTAGKNILKLRGNPINLAPNAVLEVEILDYNGQPIYHESTTYIAEDRSRVISIYIYPDTPAGEARIILVTKAIYINKQEIPAPWKDVYNVKWIRKTYVNPTLPNISEILFETLPVVTIEEQTGVQLNRVYANTQYPLYTAGKVSYQNKNDQSILLISGGIFVRDMVGGTVNVPSPVNPTPVPYYNYTLPTYTSKIKKVLSDTAILLETPYLIAASQSIIPHQFDRFDNSTYSINYTSTPAYSATQNSESYALVKIDNLEPAAGDISRIKVFINNLGTVGTWEQVTDIELEETEIFVTSTASLTPDKSIGFIDSQNTIDTYFTAPVYDGKQLLGTALPIFNTSVLNNSMYISANSISNAAYDPYLASLIETYGFSQPWWWDPEDIWPPPAGLEPEYITPTSTSAIILKIQDSYSGVFLKDSNYKVKLDAYSVGPNAKILAYISGSAFNIDTTDQYNQKFPIKVGKRIGELDSNLLGSRIDDYEFNFKSDNNGTGVLLFIIERGDWYLSDIRTTSDNDAGYTPNYTRIRTLIPTAHKADVQLNFKVEYYNVAGNKCKQINYVNNVPWTGGNRYIDGDYSMLTGSLYVADSLNSGIGISGYSNTGFIRSLGYSGFDAGYPGFLLWSGSALGGALSKGVAYSGVGLELYANSNNYFRYSTRDSELDIRTNKIYIGNTSTFISASNGNLQISSSNFTIAANGDVSLTGAVNITGGSGYATPASVSSSINAATSSLSSSLNNTITSNSSSAASALTSTSASLNTRITSVSSSLSSSLSSVSSSITDRIVTDANNKIIKTNDVPSSGQGLYLSQRYLGYYSGGSWNSYISSSGEFKFEKDANNLISFGNNSLILKVSDQATISGSNINLLTPNFYFGGTTQYISGSGGNIAISSSNFHLDRFGNVTLRGDVNITGGTGFATPASVSSSINTATGSLSASLNTTITSNSSSAASSLTSVSSSVNTRITSVSSSGASALTSVSSSTAERIVTDANNKIIKPNNAPTTGNGLYLSQNYLGYYSGSTSPILNPNYDQDLKNSSDYWIYVYGWTNWYAPPGWPFGEPFPYDVPQYIDGQLESWPAYISSSGEFKFEKDANNLISFGNNAFTLKVSDAATISGSNINLITPSFFFGNNTQYISGSNGNLQIESNNFKVKTNGDVSASSMLLKDVAYADGFVYTTAVINDYNYTQYFENYTLTGLSITGSSTTYSRNFTKLVLDGSKGGVSATQIRLERQPDWPIGMIIPPGYLQNSSNGYTITIENWAYHQSNGNATIYFANAVASSSNAAAMEFDFGLHCDQWDKNASAFTARPLGPLAIRGLPTGSDPIVYGSGSYGHFNTYNDSNRVLRSQILAINYGTMAQFQRTTSNPAYPDYDGYWQMVNIDDTRGIRQYIGGGMKLGNVGSLIGGTGNIGSAIGEIHFTTPHSSAVLQLDAGNSNASASAAGSGSVFIPPRITDDVQNALGNAVIGSIIYNTTDNKLRVYTNTGWVDLH